ncbi:MAG: hypothetical protein J6R94_03595, partial [Agathobacter sp.]|nr:hypothetical protein [Agathobacter sp.]
MSIVEGYLSQLNTEKRRWWRAVLILVVLSIAVAFVTIWNLRLIGITIANGATCGKEEHQHIETCWQGDELICDKEEHIHEILCYSDTKADLETEDDWKGSLPKLTGNKREDVLLIAQSQLGYQESEKNYTLSEDGQSKCGITRYGQWYGNPYGEWANMFTSFCLRYAGLSDELIHSGAEVMRNSWIEEGIYRDKGTHEPKA